MRVNKVEIMRQSVPLTKPFKTALRTVTSAESVIVKVTADDGSIGWGEAPATVNITGDSLDGIHAIIRDSFRPILIGSDIASYERILQSIHQAAIGNPSAKAAIDMAVYDLAAQRCGVPLYQFLGGYRDQLETDCTVSVNDPREMVEDASRYVAEGFTVLKVKVGKDEPARDLERLKLIRSAVGERIKIRVDANQGWLAKDAIRFIRRMEDAGLDIELVEQPVKAHDIEGLRQVTHAVDMPIMADESVFSPAQAYEVLQKRAADMINVKLMKAGGIYKALRIIHAAEEYGIECMMGSMIESRIAVTAAAHLAAGLKNVTKVDFDAPLMLKEDPTEGGIRYDGSVITFGDGTGLGIQNGIGNKIL